MYQIGDALPFDAQFKETKLGKTGLTVTVDVYRNGTLVVSDGSSTELALGWYYYVMSSSLNTVAGQYRAVFKTATTTVDDRQIPSLRDVGAPWAQRIDENVSAAKTLTSGAINAAALDPTASAELIAALLLAAISGGTVQAALEAALNSGGAGVGALTYVYTLTSSVDSTPVDDCAVWVTTDSAGTNVIASGRTNASGVVTFYLDAGTYYFWRSKSGWNFTNPDTEVVA